MLLFVSTLVNLPLLPIAGHMARKRITNNMMQPVQDDDPYVRKTAAVCVAKLHDINAELVEDRGFLDTLKVILLAASSRQTCLCSVSCWANSCVFPFVCAATTYTEDHDCLCKHAANWPFDIVVPSQDLLADSNPMVVANAVAALAEIQEVSGRDVFQITSQSLFKLLRALNECTEWGQVRAPYLCTHLLKLSLICTCAAQLCKSLTDSLMQRLTFEYQHVLRLCG